MTETTLKQRINEDIKAAMRNKEQRLLDTLRLVTAAIKQREVDERIVLDDVEVLAVLDKMIKQRRDSAAQFQQGNRQDLADQEFFEIAILERYLPIPLTAAEIEQHIQQAITRVDAKSLAQMGQVMAVLKPELQGRADMAIASAKVKEYLLNAKK